ncbi:MAG: Rne/Rng family ribonuclease [Paludibacteraceae bacterium]|nr:Rne/Rng family ribonuclease [Paludibacteraceae bacterium]
MKSELFVDVQPKEIALALVEDDRLMEVSREKREMTFVVGNIYVGRVKKVMPSLNAVFVDVGYEKEAFLHYLDLGENFLKTNIVVKSILSKQKTPDLNQIYSQDEISKEGQISDYLNVGDHLLVQISKEPINTKGPRLTSEISLAGRNIVLLPYGDKVMVSNKIKSESERSRLRQLVQSIKPQGYGVIVRTVAEGKRVAELDGELQLLIKRWEDSLKKMQQLSEPKVALVNEEIGRTTGLLRDIFNPETFEKIEVNDEEVYEDICAYVELIAPGCKKIVHYYKDEQPIFDHFQITRQMKTGLGRTVGFKNGGYLIVERTEALWSIDVNSGSKNKTTDQEENAINVNMLAADEIAHQLRLRDIGGIIIIDFIDMDSAENQQLLYDHMRELLARDRAKHNILKLSKIGVMQITRQRVRPAVEINVQEVCPTCMGRGKIQPSIMFTDMLEEEIAKYAESFKCKMRLYVHPYPYAYLSKGWLNSIKSHWRRKYGVKVLESQEMAFLQYKFTDRKGHLLLLNTPHEHPSNQQEQK